MNVSSIFLGGLWAPEILSITLAAVLLITSVVAVMRARREDLPAVLDAIGRWLPWRRKD